MADEKFPRHIFLIIINDILENKLCDKKIDWRIS